MTVPRDDGTTNLYLLHFSETDDLDEEAVKSMLGIRPGIDFDATGARLRTRANNFLQDRDAMANGSFSGIRGVAQQDIAIWESMARGPIIDRSREHLGRTDMAIVQFRRIMLDAVDDFAAKGRVLSQEGPVMPLGKLRSYEGIVAHGTNWEMLGLCDEERLYVEQNAAAQ